MRLALWTPRPGDGWVAALTPLLAREVTLEVLDREPTADPAPDLDVYHLADDPSHGFVYRGLLRRPGLVVLEEWSLHELVRGETAGRGDADAYRREARRAHGSAGEFVARQVLRGLGGRLPTLLPLNRRVLEAGLGFAVATEAIRARVAARVSPTPILHLPLAFLAPAAACDRSPARSASALPSDRPLVVAVQPAGGGEPARRIVRALDDVRKQAPHVAIAWRREEDPAVATDLVAAELVVAIEDPPRAGLGRAIPLAVAAGRPTLVTAGSGAAVEMPEGVVAHVTPGPTEAGELVALVRRLLVDEPLRASMGRLARTFAAERSDPVPCARALLELVLSLPRGREAAVRAGAARGDDEAPLVSGALEELGAAAAELGFELPPDVGPLVVPLFGGREG